MTRGFQLKSDYAPTRGYRYDGLYRIVSYGFKLGLDGFRVVQFRLERMEGQAPIGELDVKAGGENEEVAGNANPPRVVTTVNRIIRDTAVTREVKDVYDNTCQFCRTRLTTPVGGYAEGCHVRPLGKPHNGPDTSDNILCLCPNCHVLFDMHALTIDENLCVKELSKPIYFVSGRSIHPDHVKYRIMMSGSI